MIVKKETAIEVDDQTFEAPSGGNVLNTAYHGYGFTEVSTDITPIKINVHNIECNITTLKFIKGKSFTNA